jgi:hypothetical protein
MFPFMCTLIITDQESDVKVELSSAYGFCNVDRAAHGNPRMGVFGITFTKNRLQAFL